MSRSRSRSRERKKDRHRDRSRKRSKDRRSRSRDKDKKSRDHKRRDRSHSRDRHHRKRSRDRSTERHREKRRDSRDRREPRSSSSSVKPIIITANIKHRSKASRAERSTSEAAKVDHRKSFEISNEFSEEGFEQFSRDHGIDFSNIETDEDRQELHAKMEDVLKEHFAAQGKIYPPPKPEIPAVNAATGFANDGSFLEQFKKMQDEYKQQLEEEKKRQAAENRLKSLPLRRRGGGKILKTGIVAKNVMTQDNNQQQQTPSSSSDAFALYFKELQKYKNASCDGDSKTRPLVK